MSLVLRLRHHVHHGFCNKTILSSVIACDPFWSTGLTRTLAQVAMKEEEVEEVEIEQRRLPTDYDPATFDPTEHRSPPTERVWRLVDEISSLTLAENAELGRIVLKKLGMKEPPVVGVMKPGAAGLAGMAMKGPAEAKEEKKAEKTVFEMKPHLCLRR